ncbi:MAG: AbrB/MazE/SpoVT family DNA-binding domain-containing protein [Salinirussus sp.]
MSRNDTEPAVRKVQRTGGSTFTVSLPKEWALRQNLAAGTEVYLYTFEDRLVVAPAEHPEAERRVQVFVHDVESDVIGRDIRRAYAAGADHIVVTADAKLTSDQRRAAIEALTELVGFRVTDETDTQVEGRSVLDASSVSLEQTVAQLNQHVMGMIREGVAAILAGDMDRGRSTIERETEVDRLVALVTRQFHGALVHVHEIDRISGDREQAYRHVQVARALQIVADAAARIGLVAAAGMDKPNRDVRDAIKECGDALRALLRAALGGDRAQAASETAVAREKIEGIDRAISDADCNQDVGRVREALSMGIEAAARIAALRLGQEFD